MQTKQNKQNVQIKHNDYVYQPGLHHMASHSRHTTLLYHIGQLSLRSCTNTVHPMSSAPDEDLASLVMLHDLQPIT